MDAPRTTIAVPTLDRNAMLQDAVRSCLAQTDQDLEILVVDNCSAEPAALAADLADPRVRTICNSSRLSAVENWNLCLKEARGRFFTILCDDDVLLPSFLSSMIPPLENDPDCALSTCPWNFVDEQLRIRSRPWQNIWKFFPLLEPAEFALHVLGMRRALTLTGSVCPTATLRAVGGFREVGFAGPWAADHHAFFRVAFTGNLVHTASEPQFLYRMHGSSLTSAANRSNAIAPYLSDYLDHVDEMRGHFPDQPAFEAAKERFAEFYENR